MTGYSSDYHKACAHLVAFGGHGGTQAARRAARDTIARALRGLRATHGRTRATYERYHLLFISGQFPVK